MKCPECGFKAAGPSTLAFHLKHVCGDAAELRRLIEEQQRDMRTRFWQSFSTPSLDRVFEDENGGEYSLYQYINSEGKIGVGSFWR